MPRCTNASLGLAWRNAGRLATSAAALLLARAGVRTGVVGAPGAAPVAVTVLMSSDVAAGFAASGSPTQPAKIAAVDSAIKRDPIVLYTYCLHEDVNEPCMPNLES